MKRPARQTVIILGTIALFVAGRAPHSRAAASPEPNSPAQWEAEIKAYEKGDLTNAPARGGILFVGSSSIRLWKTLPEDFAGLPVFARGFGGSKIADSVHFVDRIILPYQPRLVLLYAGDNDIASKKTPAEVLADFQALVKKIHDRLPETRVAYIAIKPSLARWHLVEQVKAANQLIKTWTKQDPRLQYIDVYTPMLNSEGKPRAELFVADGLHLNSRGYELWTGIIKPFLK